MATIDPLQTKADSNPMGFLNRIRACNAYDLSHFCRPTRITRQSAGSNRVLLNISPDPESYYEAILGGLHADSPTHKATQGISVS